MQIIYYLGVFTDTLNRKNYYPFLNYIKNAQSVKAVTCKQIFRIFFMKHFLRNIELL